MGRWLGSYGVESEYVRYHEIRNCKAWALWRTSAPFVPVLVYLYLYLHFTTLFTTASNFFLYLVLLHRAHCWDLRRVHFECTL